VEGDTGDEERMTIDLIKSKTTFDLAFERTGTSQQLDKTVEECSELIQAIMKARSQGSDYTLHILEEMGHVELCIEMIKSQLSDMRTGGGQYILQSYDYMKEKRLNAWYAFEIEEMEKRNGGVD